MAARRIYFGVASVPGTPLPPAAANAVANAYREADVARLEPHDLYKALVAGRTEWSGFSGEYGSRHMTFQEFHLELSVTLRAKRRAFAPLLFLPGTPDQDFAPDFVFSPAANAALFYVLYKVCTGRALVVIRRPEIVQAEDGRRAFLMLAREFAPTDFAAIAELQQSLSALYGSIDGTVDPSPQMESLIELTVQLARARSVEWSERETISSLFSSLGDAFDGVKTMVDLAPEEVSLDAIVQVVRGQFRRAAARRSVPAHTAHAMAAQGSEARTCNICKDGSKHFYSSCPWVLKGRELSEAAVQAAAGAMALASVQDAAGSDGLEYEEEEGAFPEWHIQT
jgi:hypothetical protein